MSIYNKLLKVQNELKAPKGQYNNFGKYKYRSCEDILEATKPLCFKEDITLVISDEIAQIGERYYVKATAKLFDDKECIEVTAYAREEESKKGMDGSQVTGASSSYARKYALNGLFNIDDTKDSDATNTHNKDDAKTSKQTKQTEPTREVTDEELYKLFALAEQAGYTKDTVFKQVTSTYKRDTPDLLKKAEYNQLLVGYQKLVDKLAKTNEKAK